MTPPSLLFRVYFIVLLGLLAPVRVWASTVDDKDDAAFVGQGRLLRFDYANDYFTGTDRYYTQGVGLTYFDPILRASPLMRVLVALPGAQTSYGLVVRQSGFTPTSLSHNEVLVGDRPFAAYLFLGHELVSRDAARGLALTTALDAGVIGQAAGGKWEQVGLHRLAPNNIAPLGWDNQIRNDLVLDYRLRLQKNLAAARRADLDGYVDASLGTLYTNAAVGVLGRVGAIADGKHRFYLFAGAEQKAVGYDATLQGGAFNRHSPYTLTSEQIERRVSIENVGFVADFGGFALEVKRVYLSREFTTELSHEWVEISAIKRF
jgi:lipid A 3-O-deacylase